MIVNLTDIFFYIDKEDFEKDINGLLDSYHLDHSGFQFYSSDKVLHIYDDEGEICIEMMLSVSKRSYFTIDIVNALTQFYVYKTNDNDDKYSYNFIKDCSDIILGKVNLPLFKFKKVYSEKGIDDKLIPCVSFQLYKNEYKISIIENLNGGDIDIVKVFVNTKDKPDAEDKFLPLIKSKPIKIYANPYIDILYQMMLYSHYFIDFVKGNSNWDKI